MEELDLQDHQTVGQSWGISEVLHRWRHHSDDSAQKWVEVGGDDGVFARQEWVFNWGEVEEIGKVWVWGVAEQEQAFHDAIVFEEDRWEAQNRKGACGFEQLARAAQILIRWDCLRYKYKLWIKYEW